MNLEQYYKFRKYIYKICTKQIDNDFINSVSNMIGDYDICKVSINPKSDIIIISVKDIDNNVNGCNKIEKIKEIITEKLKLFILSNSDQICIPDNEKNEFLNYVNDGIMLYEHCVIGDSIYIIL